MSLDRDKKKKLPSSDWIEASRWLASVCFMPLAILFFCSCLQAVIDQGEIEKYALAKSAWVSGNVAETKAILEPLWQANPQFAQAGFLLARVYFSEKKAAKAIPLLEQVRRLQADNIEATVWLAQALMQTGKDKEAEALVSKSLESNPDEPRLSFIMASIYERKDNLAGALGFLQAASRLEEDLGLIYLETARLQYRFGRLTEAKEVLRKAQSILPDSSLLGGPVRELSVLLAKETKPGKGGQK